jgi:hypothetical protein
MSEPAVDFSQIRGDWYFHLNYLNEAVDNTLKRAVKLWQEVGKEANAPEIGKLLDRQVEAWAKLNAQKGAKGEISIHSPLMDEFFAAAQATKALCDALEETKGLGGSASIYDTQLEHFTEALRQARGFVPDLEMMREQKPD